jgi:putative transcriptional regulator
MSNLKSIREKAGLTQVVLARYIGLTQSAIAHYESGRRKPPLDECRRIVIALNTSGADVTLDDVFPPAETKQSAA